MIEREQNLSRRSCTGIAPLAARGRGSRDQIFPARSSFATAFGPVALRQGRTSLGRTVITISITSDPARTQGLFSHPAIYESHEKRDPVAADHRTSRANLFRDPFDGATNHHARLHETDESTHS